MNTRTVVAAFLLVAIAHLEAVPVRISAKADEALVRFLEGNPSRSAGKILDTGSMAPTLDRDFIVITEKRDFADLHEGLIPIFSCEWTRVQMAHRIIGGLVNGFQTQGDACNRPDSLPLRPENYGGSILIAAIHILTGEVRILGENRGEWSRPPD